MRETAAGFVTIGEIVKAVGLKGEFKLYPLLDYHAPLLESRYLVWDDGSPAEIDRYRTVGGSCVAIKARRVDRRDEAEALVGREIGFLTKDYLADDFPRPACGLPFRYLGRRVVTGDGRSVGLVDEVRRNAGGFMLVVPADGDEILIPAVSPILRRDDGLEGDLVIDPPKGLLDVHRR